MTAPSHSLKELFFAGLEVAPNERAAWLQHECGADAELRERLALLLAAHDAPQSLLDRPGQMEPMAGFQNLKGASPTVDSTAAESTGALIGPYKLLQQIGEGGMGVVYMAEQHEPVKRRVALKIIKPGMDTRQVIARFEAERQALSLMDHPNIAKVLDAGTTDAGRPFFVMELVKGQPITQYCDEHHLTPRQRLELLLPVCQAIQHAHQKGIIHRDIKPTNILVAEYDQQPVPKVIDFGVAKAISQSLTEKTMFTGLGQIVGTLEYMSPEQAKVNQLDIDTRSDIYSLGVLLYELLTGSTPFDKQRLRSAGWDEMLRIIREEEPPKPSTRLSDSHDSLPSISALRQTEPAKLTRLVRGELDWIVMKALEKDRNRRYETANGLALDLQRYLDDEPVVACPPSAVYRFHKFVRRHRIGVGASLFIMTAILVSLVGLVVANRLITREKNEKSAALQQSQISEQEATSQKKLAEAHAKAATEQRVIAVANEKLAKQNELLARRRFYASQMNLAMQAWRTGEVARTLALLEAQRGRTAEDDLRGFDWYYLWGLCQGGRQFLRGHTGSLRDVAFSPSGKELASACWDRTVRVWDVETGQQKHVLTGHANSAWTVVYSPDGKVLASGGQETDCLILWDANTGQRLHTIPGSFYGLAFTADSRKLAGGFVPNPGQLSSIDAKIWDLETRAEEATLKNSGLVVGFLPDGKSLVTHKIETAQTEVQIWDWPTGTKRLSISAGEAGTHCVAISPDGSQVALTPSHGRVARFDTATGKPCGNLPTSTVMRRLVFSPDGKQLAGGGEDRTVTLWDLQTGSIRGKEYHAGQVRAVAFSPDGQKLASGSIDDGLIKVWDGSAASEATTYSPSDARKRLGIETLRFTPDGKTLIVGYGEPFSPNAPYAPFDTSLVDVASGQQVRTFPLGSAAISADASKAVSWIDNGQLTVWELDQGRAIAKLTPRHSNSNLSKEWEGKAMPRVALSPDGKRLASFMRWGGQRDESIKLWDVTTQQVRVLTGEPPPSNRMWPVCATFSPSGRLLAAGYGFRYFIVWDVGTGAIKLQHVISRSGQPQVYCVAFNPDETLLAVGTDDGSLTVWEIETGRFVAECTGHTSPLLGICFSPDGQVIATAGKDGTVRLWDAATGQERLTLVGHTGAILSITFSPDGNALATGDFGCQVRIWRGSTHPEAKAYRTQQKLDDPNFPYADLLSSESMSLTTDPDPSKWNPTLALAKAEKSAALLPNRGAPQLAIGIAHYRLGNWSQAIAALEKYLALEPDRLGYAGYFLAMSHWQIGHSEQAQHWYKQAQKYWERNPNTGQRVVGRRLEEEAQKLLGDHAKD